MERGNRSWRGRLTRAPPTRPLDERAAAAAEEEEEEPVIEWAALCGEGGSVLRMLRVINPDHLSEKLTKNP
jgi:hypothetical protein